MPKAGESWILTLSKEKKGYSMTDGKNKWILKYNVKEHSFSTTMFKEAKVISYDENNKRLVLKNKNNNGQSSVLKRL